MVTIYSLLLELKTWFNPSAELLEKAKKSTISTKTSKSFKQLVKGWQDGLFDEDPRHLYDEVCYLLNK